MSRIHSISLPHASKRGLLLLLIVLVPLVFQGCSVRRLAINKIGDALAGSGTTFASDDDPELVRDAAPFSLKLMESILAETPEHRGLLQATASGFTQYAYAFVQQDADELESVDYAQAEALRERARRLYRRARDYGLRGLEVKYQEFEAQVRREPLVAVQRLKKSDVPLVYWTTAAWGAYISLSKDNPEAIANQVLVEALADRALALDESYAEGALHAFLISYESARQGAEGDPESRARAHFQRAMELSSGRQAGPLVALAEAVCIQKQDAKEFQQLLEQALAINPDEHPESRLVNLVMQRRARWLLSRLDDLFLLELPPLAPPK